MLQITEGVATAAAICELIHVNAESPWIVQKNLNIAILGVASLLIITELGAYRSKTWD